ncbi:C1QL [Mytilus edulis]|uniref:C1QL n=1 Tax=Mytilus edulis TaxID=6550 RepID=A0A8S3SRV9_MYTED|nr:C1QL [Mytilus edulis]
MQFKALLVFLISIVVQTNQGNETRNLSTGANDHSILAIILRQLFRIEAKQNSSPRLTDTLVQTINENKKLYELLQKQVTDNKDETSKLSSTINLLKTNLQLQKSEFNRKISALRKHHEKVPAFTATFSNNGLMSLAHGQILKFDKVHFNNGGGYDPTTGYFTPKRTGVYLMSCTVRATDHHLHVSLWRNSHQIMYAYGNSWNTGSFSIAVDVKMGDKLYIKHVHRNNEVVQGGPTSFFSGVFISG